MMKVDARVAFLGAEEDSEVLNGLLFGEKFMSDIPTDVRVRCNAILDDKSDIEKSEARDFIAAVEATAICGSIVMLVRETIYQHCEEAESYVSDMDFDAVY